MDPELKGRLKVIEDKLEQNRKLLLRIRRVQKNATLFRLFYWGLIILIGLGAFYFIQPYIDSFSSGYENVKESFSDLKNFSSFMEQIKGKE